MPKYIVEKPLTHDGVEYLPGSPVELDDNQAESLLQVGVISVDANEVPRLTANEVIAKVKAAENIAALNELAAGEERKSVMAAIAAKRTELAPAE